MTDPSTYTVGWCDCETAMSQPSTHEQTPWYTGMEAAMQSAGHSSCIAYDNFKVECPEGRVVVGRMIGDYDTKTAECYGTGASDGWKCCRPCFTAQN